MTFTEIVQDVMTRLNLSSEDARVRVGQRVNERYKKLTSSIGLITSRRTTLTLTVDFTDTARWPDLPEMDIVGLEKIDKISTTGTGDDPQGILVLKMQTYDEISNMRPFDRAPRAWAVKRMGAGMSTIIVDGILTGSPIPLTFEGYDITPVLSDDAEPFLPTDFHDILIEGAMADELSKMEKPELAQVREQNYLTRASDLRMFIAKSSYIDIFQGKNKPNQLWYRQWYSRIGLWN